MRFYRVSFTIEAGTSAGFEWFTSKRDAERVVATWHKDHHDGTDESARATIDDVEIGTTKESLLSALNRYAAHPDNG